MTCPCSKSERLRQNHLQHAGNLGEREYKVDQDVAIRVFHHEYDRFVSARDMAGLDMELALSLSRYMAHGGRIRQRLDIRKSSRKRFGRYEAGRRALRRTLRHQGRLRFLRKIAQASALQRQQYVRLLSSRPNPSTSAII